MEVASPIDRVNEAHEFVCPWWRTADEVDRSLRRGTGIIELGGVSVEERSESKHLETLECCINLLRAHHAAAPFLEIIS